MQQKKLTIENKQNKTFTLTKTNYTKNFANQ